ncbi:unnamed protein product [marine sediment metagenome]|uniref:Uncharacterized protein n=1 Tax=marine sediment metagenome TaxID=412755 RepID=X1SJE0_9ZZZZ
MSRKKIEIDWEIVDKKLSDFCDGSEIAACLGISFDTLERRIKQEFNADFADYKAQKRAIGTGSLRELQRFGVHIDLLFSSPSFLSSLVVYF